MLAAHVARDLARIGVLLERHWAPYSKWLTTAFARLTLADQVGPQPRHALSARSGGNVKQRCAPGREHDGIVVTAHLSDTTPRSNSTPRPSGPSPGPPARNVNATTTPTITVTRRAEVSETARWPERLFDTLDDVDVDAVTGHRPRPGLG
jgi:hypothetical protein